MLQGGSASVEKGKGIDSAELVGCDVGRSDALVTGPCLDVDMFSDADPTPLRTCPAIAIQTSAGTMPSDWVCQMVKEIRHTVL